ncbi:MAG: hypothetical protein AB8B74_06230 [Crocinitomicaceae bacterium]
MKTRIKIGRNSLLYLGLIVGFLYLYVLDIDQIMHPEKEIEVQSKINFVYQQF